MMRLLKKSGVFLALCTVVLIANEPETVKLTPPILSQDTISEKIVCTRPMRDGKFNISLEQHLGKSIIHCYGHGGSGWTTLFGSVGKAIELFQSTHPNKDIPIRIIGSGCMGLTTAIELDRLGYHRVGISTQSLYDMPSWRAAGYFALVSVKTSPEEQANLSAIGLNTFVTYQAVDRGEHPYITKEAVKYMPVYCSIDTEAGVEDLEERGMIPPRQYVSLDFGNGIIHHGYVKYMTYFMNTTALMRQLLHEVHRRAIPIQLQEIKSFDEISEDVVFNCSGLGGRELNEDASLIPVRGHLVTLNETAGSAHMEYMIYAKVEQDGKEEYIYMFPKSASVIPEKTTGTSCAGVLGGTFIPHADRLSPAEQAQLDAVEFKRLLDRNSEFFQGHPFECPKNDSARVYIEPPHGFSSSMEVAGCFCEYEGRALFLLRNLEKPQGNTWCIPGGKLEWGEAPEQAVVREVKEETGLSLLPESLIYCGKVFVRFPNSEFALHLFRVCFTEIPTLELATEEHSAYRWVTYEEASQLPLIPGGTECLRFAFQNDIPRAASN